MQLRRRRACLLHGCVACHARRLDNRTSLAILRGKWLLSIKASRYAACLICATEAFAQRDAEATRVM